MASVPFMGCISDGPSERREAPKATSISVPITSIAAQALAYYQSAEGLGVLAPRGWFCYGVYGSSGDALFVGPHPIDGGMIGRSGFAGTVIEISHTLGNTSGRFEVAKTIARVFPAFKLSAYNLLEGFDWATSSLAFGPYPKDALTYKSNRVVEYKTPPQADGLGTHSSLKKNGNPIAGVAMIVGQTPDLLLLSVRVPSEFSELTSAIVRQVERDAETSNHH